MRRDFHWLRSWRLRSGRRYTVCVNRWEGPARYTNANVVFDHKDRCWDVAVMLGRWELSLTGRAPESADPDVVAGV